MKLKKFTNFIIQFKKQQEVIHNIIGKTQTLMIYLKML